MFDPLPIVADIPLPEPQLGFDRYASALADAIRGGQPPQFTVGIYGRWGSGKSSLLNAIQRNLSNDPNILPVFFDAWRYERSPHIVLPLLHRIDRAIEARAPADVKQKIKEALLSVMRSITVTVGPLTVDPSRGFDAQPDARDLNVMNDAFTRPYEDMRSISEALGDRRIVVMIDDLDRCSSDKVVSALEAINLVMDVPGFIFVLALDYDVLVHAVEERYPHTSGHVFIEKMVQVPVRVPRLDVRREDFLPQLLPGWNPRAAHIPDGFLEAVYDVADAALEFNPRQIKRLVNSMLVLLRVAASGEPIAVDARLLAGVVGLQLGWPKEYQDFADSVFSDDESPVQLLTASQDEDLRHYQGLFFTDDLTSAALRPVLSLTSVVADPSAFDDAAAVRQVATGGAEAMRLANAAVLAKALTDAGFTERYPNTFYKTGLAGVRVKIGKTVVRFEGRGPEGRWHLAGESFLLTTGAEAALSLIASPESLLARVGPLLG